MRVLPACDIRHLLLLALPRLSLDDGVVRVWSPSVDNAHSLVSAFVAHPLFMTAPYQPIVPGRARISSPPLPPAPHLLHARVISIPPEVVSDIYLSPSPSPTHPSYLSPAPTAAAAPLHAHIPNTTALTAGTVSAASAPSAHPHTHMHLHLASTTLGRSRPTFRVSWCQSTGLLATGGTSDVIRIWDVDQERCIQDLPTEVCRATQVLWCDSARCNTRHIATHLMLNAKRLSFFHVTRGAEQRNGLCAALAPEGIHTASPSPQFGAATTALALDTVGTLLVAGSRAGALRVWDRRERDLRTIAYLNPRAGVTSSRMGSGGGGADGGSQGPAVAYGVGCACFPPGQPYLLNHQRPPLAPLFGRAHNDPIVGVAVPACRGLEIISASRDGEVCVFDRRATTASPVTIIDSLTGANQTTRATNAMTSFAAHPLFPVVACGYYDKQVWLRGCVHCRGDGRHSDGS